MPAFNLTRWRYAFLLFLSLCASHSVAQTGEEGLPPLQQFTTRDYRAEAQNWAIEQDARGFLYIGNTNGLLEYDGHAWRRIDLPMPTAVRALARHRPTERIYVGGHGEIGFLARGPSGQMTYRSLRSKLPPGGVFRAVTDIVTTPKAVYFAGEEALFRYNGREVKRWDMTPDNPLRYIFGAQGHVYLYTQNGGLQRVWGDELQPAPGGDAMRGALPFCMLPWDEELTLVGTRDAGFFLYDGVSFLPFDFAAQRLLDGATVVHAAALPGGRFAFCTAAYGVVLTDRHGKILRIIDKQAGLNDQIAHFAFTDRTGNLWVALNNGITRLDLASPLTWFDGRNGLNQMVLTGARHHRWLYVGGYDGLHLLDTTTHTFRKVSGIEGECWAAYAGAGFMLAGGRGGLYEVEGDRARRIFDQPVGAILQSRRDPDLIYVGLWDGLTAIRRSGGWRAAPLGVDLRGDVRHLAEDRDGALWMTLHREGVARLKDGVVQRYDTTHGLPYMAGNHVFEGGGEVIFGTLKGVRRFDPGQKRFVRDEAFKYLQGDTAVDLMAWSRKGWLAACYNVHNAQRYIFQYADGRLTQRPFLPLGDDFGVNWLLAEPSGVAWLGGKDGLVRYAGRASFTGEAKFLPGVRRVTAANDSVLFDGVAGQEFVITKRLSSEEAHSLRFEVAAPYYSWPEGIRFQYLLEGFDKEWTPWTHEPHVTYTNLPGGSYRLKVQAQNAYGVESETGVLAFRVAPPWYDSWWAWLGYSALFMLIVYGVVQWRVRRLAHERHVLEEKVAVRTEEVREQARRLEASNHEIAWKNQEMERAYAEIEAQKQELEQTLADLAVKKLEADEARAELEAHSDQLIRQNYELEQAYDEIRAKNGLLKESNEELTRSRTELQAAVERLRTSQSQIVLSEKMAVLGRLVAGVAHEINTPLGAIHAAVHNAGKNFPMILQQLPGFFQRLEPETQPLFFQLVELAMEGDIISTREERQLRKDIAEKLLRLGFPDASDLAKQLIKIGVIGHLDELKPILRHARREEILDMASAIAKIRLNLDNINIAVGKTQKIIYALKSYAYSHSLDELAPTDIRQNIETVLTLYHNMLKHGVDVEINIEEDLPEIYCYPDELNQVWTNIIHNAIYAMKGRGLLELRVFRREREIVVTITDNGPGIPPELQDKIFDPFFTTKPQGEGTGLGLDLCRRIVAKHEGRISVTSQPGRTTFEVVLPMRLRAEEPVARV